MPPPTQRRQAIPQKGFDCYGRRRARVLVVFLFLFFVVLVVVLFFFGVIIAIEGRGVVSFVTVRYAVRFVVRTIGNALFPFVRSPRLVTVAEIAFRFIDSRRPVRFWSVLGHAVFCSKTGTAISATTCQASRLQQQIRTEWLSQRRIEQPCAPELPKEGR